MADALERRLRALELAITGSTALNDPDGARAVNRARAFLAFLDPAHLDEPCEPLTDEKLEELLAAADAVSGVAVERAEAESTMCGLPLRKRTLMPEISQRTGMAFDFSTSNDGDA